MTDSERSRFEEELRAIRPLLPPRRMISETLKRVGPQRVERARQWWNRADMFGWLVPAAGMALVIGTVFLLQTVPGKQTARAVAHPISKPIKADQLELNRQLVANYDAVASLPGGQPIRFHCTQWLDKVSLRDSAAGLVIERTTPRLEIVPLGFETY
jgi:hypothetical protein